MLNYFLGVLTCLISMLPVRSIFADAPSSWQIGFQDPASPTMEGIIELHNHAFFFIVVVIVYVLWILSRTVYLFSSSKNPTPSLNTHGTTLEIIWTIIPSVILAFIAVPSFALLYSMDEVVNPAVTIKAIGHQWYWSYEYSDGEDAINFDSYMLPEGDLKEGQLRLLEVDNPIYIPVNTHVRVIVTAADVLHCWAVPSLGVKIDAVPGRLNQTSILAKREGTFYGQCSELCGVNHGFMPIVVKAVSLDDYIAWLASRAA